MRDARILRFLCFLLCKNQIILNIHVISKRHIFHVPLRWKGSPLSRYGYPHGTLGELKTKGADCSAPFAWGREIRSPTSGDCAPTAEEIDGPKAGEKERVGAGLGDGC